jgi:hypothetical protein
MYMARMFCICKDSTMASLLQVFYVILDLGGELNTLERDLGH